MAKAPSSETEIEKVHASCARYQRSTRQRRLIARGLGLAIVPLLALGMIGFDRPWFDRAVANSDDPAGSLVQQGRGNGLGRRFRGGRGSGGPQVEPRAGAGAVPADALPGLTKPATEIERPPAPPALQSDEQASIPKETAQQRFETDRELFHALLSRHEEIRRDVELLEDGVRTLTEADDPELAALIKQHVKRMKTRVEAHAAVVNLFVKNGHSEVLLNHEVPVRE